MFVEDGQTVRETDILNRVTQFHYHYQLRCTSSDHRNFWHSYRHDNWYHITLRSGQHSNTRGPLVGTNVSIQKVPISNNKLKISNSEFHWDIQCYHLYYVTITSFLTQFIRSYSTHCNLTNCSVHKMNPYIQLNMNCM
jgi:hypothetical protein